MSELHLITTGGTGTYAIEEWGRPNWSESRLRAHTRSPSAPATGDRVLYVFGDPRNQLLSFFHRGFMKAPYTHCQNVNGNVNYLGTRKSWSLESYLQEEYDAYQLYEHLQGWLSHHARDYSIMFVRYEAIAKTSVRRQLREFVGQYRPFEFKPRASNFEGLSASLRQSIDRMFSHMVLLTSQLPDVTEIRCY